MEIKLASGAMLDAVKEITQTTIDQIYPHYYPAGAVDFFKQHHSDEAIRQDLENGRVYLLFADEVPIGTVTIRENHILRLFVRSEYQHRGCGRRLLDFAEDAISRSYRESVVDASFPAKHIYLKRGYADREYHTIRAENGDYLCYDVMAKAL